MTRKTRRRKSQGADLEAQPEDEEVGREEAHEMSTHTSGREGEVLGTTGGDAPVGDAVGEAEVDSASPQARAERPKDAPTGPTDFGAIDQPGDNDGLPDSYSAQPMPPGMPRMIGDFNDNANALWSLQLKEANSHDEARIQSLKDDMDSVLIFAGLFSAALTSFLVDKIHNLQADPAQQMVFYQQQNVSISSTPLPTYVFNLNPSDVRVNVFWFMSLVFSVSAALLATLVQQWVRDYMHVFQRYSNPLKSARLRQYLYEGAEGWYMPVVAESVPGLVHVSLFLFFLGLGDSLLNVNTTVGVTTVVPITICTFLYVCSMFAPVIKPQAPFRNPFSGLIWYLRQKVHPRSYLDRASGGTVKAEDDEMESFVMAIPGAFTSNWGIDVWRKASQNDPDLQVLPHHRSPLFRRSSHPLRLLQPLARILGIRIANGTPHDVTDVTVTRRLFSVVPDDLYGQGDLAIYDLCKRVRHLIGTCDNYSIFANKELWHKRARGCVETAASLVIIANIKLEMFGDLRKLFHPLYESIGRYHLAPGSDGLFVARLDCLSFIIVNQGMLGDNSTKQDARFAIYNLSQLRFGTSEDSDERTINGDVDENALKNARRIDNYFEAARQFCVYKLREIFRPSEEEATEEQVKEVLARDHQDDISELERIALATGRIADVDMPIFRINDSVASYGHSFDFTPAWHIFGSFRAD
ncbi:hypothetical protein EDB85DRAFT_2208233 [Lactarius pseudohatsudake]|nr:hypothetical protein EDB85DRAFT_2208233 [Lactarius pseudohatsudake]